jgi:uncharacterized damage-inducible protein DinB
MTNLATPALSQAALGDLAHEVSTTRRVLERVPEEHFAWRPHEKSMSLGGLALHLANLLSWQRTIVQDREFDLAATPPPATTEPASHEELLQRFDENAAALSEALAGAAEGALAEPWTLRRGEQVIMQQPRAAILRSMGISHMVHHRGQLTVYLRLLDVPVPGVYGPSADEGR